VVVGAGTAVTGTEYAVGEQGGVPLVQIVGENTPPHTHQFMAATGRGLLGNDNTPGPTKSFITAQGCTPYLPPATTPPPTMVNMDPGALSPFINTSVASHTNLMPTISMNFCICLSGITPPRG
jgi:microcystin-dependent protein